MATRFWLTSSAAPYTPTTRRGAWDVASGEDVQLLGRKPTGSAGTSSINAGSTAADRDVLLHRSISAGAIKAGTISGTMSWTIGVRESNIDCNAVWHIHAYVTSGDSDTPRGTLLADYIGASEFTTTATGTQVLAQAVTPVTIQTGDRLVVEIGYRANALVTTYNATINYGNTGSTDLGSGDTAVTTQPGWVELSGADGLFTAAFGTLTDTFTSSIDAKWTKTTGVTATGGRARIPCTTTLESLYTATAYEIQGTQIKVQVPTLPATGGGTGAGFSLYLSAGPTVQTTNLEFEYTASTGNLVLRNSVGGSDASPTTLTYDPAAHAWWRYAETGGAITMDTSPDGTTWTTRRTISTPTQWMRLGTLILYAEAQRTSGTADYAELDNANAGSTTTVAAGTASAVDTALPPGRTKRTTAGPATTVETAISPGRVKRLTITPAIDTAMALPPARTKQRTAPAATQTDTATTPGRTKQAPVAPATETNAAPAPGRTKTKTAPPATTADTAVPPTRGKKRTPAPAAQVDTALRPGRAICPTPAVDTATALAPARAKARAIAPAAAVDTALAPTRPGNILGDTRTGPARTRWTVSSPPTRWTTGPARSSHMDHASTEYVQVPVHTDTDPTGYPVRVALLPAGQRPAPDDWHTATWATIGGVPHAQLLIGPDGGALTLTPGTWRPWLDIDANPEHPYLPGVALLVT